MAVIIINPNSTASMTDAMVGAAMRAVPERAFTGWTSTDGPPSIQGPEDGRAATPPLLTLTRKAGAEEPDGIIIGCFDDTALSEAAAVARCPVVGLGQASFHYAALRNWRFSIVTTLPVSVPVIEDNITAMGLGQSVRRVRASNVPVLGLESDPDAAGDLILAEALKAQAEDDIDAVILGCAGMVGLTERVTRALDIAVLDPVIIAARSMRWLG